MFFPEEWIEELTRRADIVQTIGSYVPLKRAGRNYIGLCPFHNEKTASFNVSPDKQFYHCFGCKASGNVIHFIMGMENLSFPEACTFLAQQHNLPLPEQTADPAYQQRKSKKERILQANKEAAMIYHKLLWEPRGKQVLDYFKSRGLSDAQIIKFGLGATCFHNIVSEQLTAKGFTIEQQHRANLVRIKNGQAYDVFKNRAMFPIIGFYGDVIGFGGRALGDDKPKYLNTSDTLVFNKRKNVYAGNLLRKEKDLQRVLLVEGYMDVIALDQFGVKGAVATLGTALTPEQVQIIARYGREIHVCYDGDEAGKKATDRAVGIIGETQKISARVLQIPGKQDPDEYVRAYGKEAFEKLKPLHGKLYVLERLKQDFNLEDEFQRTQYHIKSIEVLLSIESNLELNNLLDSACSIIGIPKSLLLSELQTQRPQLKQALADKQIKQVKQEFRNKNKQIPNEELLFLAIMSLNRLPLYDIDVNIFGHALTQRVFALLKQGKSVLQIFNEIENEEEKILLSDTFMKDYSSNSEDELMKIAQDCVRKMKISQYLDRKRILQQEFDQYNEEQQLQAMDELLKIHKQISKLQGEAQ